MDSVAEGATTTLDASPEGETPWESSSPEDDPDEAVGATADPETTADGEEPESSPSPAEPVGAESETWVEELDSWVTGVLPGGGANVDTGCKYGFVDVEATGAADVSEPFDEPLDPE